jgi:integrase
MGSKLPKVYLYEVPRKDGSVAYKIQWREPIARNQRAETYEDKDEALRRKAILEGEMAKGIHKEVAPGRIKYGDYWNETYLPEHIERNLSPKAAAGYKRYGQRNILPFLAETYLSDINKSVVVKWSHWAQDQGFALSTIEYAFVVLRSSLTYAADIHDLIPENPIQGKKFVQGLLPKRAKKREISILTPEQISMLSDAVRPRYKALVMVLGFLGLRPGEAIGLRIGDLNLTEGYLMVRRSVVSVEGKMTANDTTKTYKTRRVNLPPSMVDALIEHITNFVDEPTDENALVFCGERLKRYLNTTYLRTIIHDAGQRLGLKVTTYDLRHSATVNAMNATGGDTKWVTEQFGNSVETMLSTYHHITQDVAASHLTSIEGLITASQIATLPSESPQGGNDGSDRSGEGL